MENNINKLYNLNRRSIRLKGYDYSRTGLYFVTICCQNKIHLFGKIVDDRMILNDFGIIAYKEWIKSEDIRIEIKLHDFIIMPNHFHAIVEIVGANGRSPVHGDIQEQYADGSTDLNKEDKKIKGINISMQAKSVGSLMSGYKSSVTLKVNKIRNLPARAVWQRNYWEHIIRNEDEYNRIKNYIISNTEKWEDDKLHGGKGNRVLDVEIPYNEEPWMVCT